MKKLLKSSWIWVFIAYLIINIFFNYRYIWSELYFDRSKIGAVEGEIYATEWGLEQNYQKIINKENPFSPIKTLLYPFGMNIVGGDGGLSVYFIFLRPFFSTHQSLKIIIAVNLLIANLAMYALLRKIGFTKIISFLMGLSYGYMTFLTPRLGAHPNYAAIGLLPLFYLFSIAFLKAKKITEKIINSVGIALIFFLTFWQNIYYFIILLLSIVGLVFYFIWKNRINVFNLFKKNFFYSILILLIILLLFFPVFVEFYKISLFLETPKSVGWAGAIELSADLFGFFIPSIYNRYYGSFIAEIGKNWKFGGAFEHFIYPGILILTAYLCFAVFYKKISNSIKKEVLPYLLTSLIFLILTFGPFLHILGKWWIEVDESIKLYLPLPFVLLHYVPFLGNIRAPGRLIVGFIFFAYIVTAYLLSYFTKNKTKKFKTIFFLVIFVVIMIDNRYEDRIGGPNATFYPKKIFNKIKNDKEKISVLEIPFVVRDGFTYFGDYNSILSIVGQMSHQKPILGGYSGRIPDYIKQYYQNNYFIGYLGRKIDESVLINPIANQLDLDNWQTPKLQESLNAIDFLDLKYVIVNEEKYFHKEAITFLEELGFKKQLTEKNFSLLVRQPTKKEFLKVDLLSPESSTFLGLGWNLPEREFRWSNRRSSVMFKLQEKRKMTLNFVAEAFYKNQPVTIYVNEKKVAQVTITTKMNNYKIPINIDFEKGINTVNFVFKYGYRPIDLDKFNSDIRKLSAKFKIIKLEEINN